MAKIVDKEAKKQEIMQAAMRVFAQKGVGGTKVHDIAKAAGVSQGTLYLYFKSKEDIFEQFLKMHAGMFESFAERITAGATDPRDKLKRLIPGMCQATQNEHASILLDVWAAMIREPERFHSEENLTNAREMIQDILDEGVQAGIFDEIDSHSLASALMGMQYGLQVLWMMNNAQCPSINIAEYAIDIILQGIEKTEVS